MMSEDINEARIDVMRSFKLEDLKRKKLPEFVRKARQDIINRRNGTADINSNSMLPNIDASFGKKYTQDFGNFIEEKLTVNKTDLDEYDKDTFANMTKFPRRKKLDPDEKIPTVE